MAWFGTQAAANGRARVLLDGVPAKEVGTNGSSTSHRRVLYRARWPQSGRHTISIEVMGTPGHPYVVVDGFVVVGPPPEDPVLVGAGDIATCGVSGASRTAALLDATPGRVFAAGDLAYPTGTAAQFRDCYGPTWGRWRLRTSPVPGNHEYLSAGAGTVLRLLRLPVRAPGAGLVRIRPGDMARVQPERELQRGGLHGRLSPGSLARRRPRGERPPLRGSHLAPAIVLVRPARRQRVGAAVLGCAGGRRCRAWSSTATITTTSGSIRRRPRALADPSGIREFVVGTGGGTLRPFATVRANSVVREASTLGVLRLTLHDGGYSWRFLPVAGRSFTDAGTGSCR